jgi:hypothetical protein
MIDPVDAELLEALDPAHDVHQRVQGADFVQRHRLGGHAVNLALRFADESERPDRALLDPGRERRLLYDRQQLTNVAVRTVEVAVTVGRLMRAVVSVVGLGGRRLG